MKRRALKRHVQQELPKPDKNGQFRGGRRKGAGRPRVKTAHGTPYEPRTKRPRVKASHPLHVVVRVKADVGSLRTLACFEAIREARVTTMHVDAKFRIVHFSIQRTHIHLIVEAEDKKALSRGMQGFSISCAKQINAALTAIRGERRRGAVFTDRYYARPLRTPREVRNCLSYVLNNWRHHEADREPMRQPWKIDPFSSALAFDGWKERPDGARFRIPPGYEGSWIWLPRTWLLTTGWRRHGRISIFDVPGRGDE